ncbi:sugar ABC transporter permease [Plantactinospora sp. KLBMP9567]|uniref:carbohydrate ABC transporter permease n=1 Tax=Plantactinospora sp. KLBMP9567 TaxID=3085900 RepID=UPI0029812793|nr:sugar ABC transporter permease [Plantactinospora sp. KLBMP9567]MDW5323880.1 sugar ABC transporter permease [Plantactinospora sp. KLBMP9567]
MKTTTAWTARWERLSRSQRENLNGQFLTAPSLLLVTLVVLLPFVLVVVFALSDTRLIDIPRLSPSTIEWSFDNFRDAAASEAFWDALWTTIAYAALTTVGSIGVGLALALALRRPFRGRGLVRALLLIPYVLPVIAAAMIWRTMLNPQYGIVNAVGQEYLGWQNPIGFLSTTSAELAGVPVPVSLLVVICFEIWKSFPLAFLFITARLQSVPGEIEEAGALDGASGGQNLRHLVLPQLRGVILLLLLLRFIWSFQNFNDVYLLTEGAGGTQVMAIKVYTELITRADIGSAAAYGLLMSLILSVLLAGYVLLSRRREPV